MNDKEIIEKKYNYLCIALPIAFIISGIIDYSRNVYTAEGIMMFSVFVLVDRGVDFYCHRKIRSLIVSICMVIFLVMSVYAYKFIGHF